MEGRVEREAGAMEGEKEDGPVMANFPWLWRRAPAGAQEGEDEEREARKAIATKRAETWTARAAQRRKEKLGSKRAEKSEECECECADEPGRQTESSDGDERKDSEKRAEGCVDDATCVGVVRAGGRGGPGEKRRGWKREEGEGWGLSLRRGGRSADHGGGEGGVRWLAVRSFLLYPFRLLRACMPPHEATRAQWAEWEARTVIEMPWALAQA